MNMDKDNSYEIPFGAFDSELKGWEYTIPEGMEAVIKDGKIIVREKESEDEGIRKGLIEHLKELKEQSVEGSHLKRPEHYDAWISWLEKQGSHIKFLQSIQIGDEVTRNPDGVLVNLSQFKRKAEQGSQNLANSKKTCKDEPKFKASDWVVYNGDICQIVKREEGCNKLVTNFGIEKELVNERNLSTAQPWTIQDAKDGDILCTYECDEPKIVFVLKRTPKKHYALSYYCYYNIMYPYFEFDSESGCLAPNDEDVKPATQEQRNLLFQKMKEAGYEWDAEKKELRKVEQNPAWSEEDERHKNTIIRAIHGAGNITPIEGELAEKWLKLFIERYTWKPSDEQMKQLGLVVELNKGTLIGEGLMTLFNHLNKLKG